MYFHAENVWFPPFSLRYTLLLIVKFGNPTNRKLRHWHPAAEYLTYGNIFEFDIVNIKSYKHKYDAENAFKLQTIIQIQHIYIIQ